MTRSPTSAERSSVRSDRERGEKGISMGKETTRALRVDLLIAVCALLASSLAAAAAVYQGFVIARQLSATVWPYIDFRESSSDTVVELAVQNVGAGPAVIGGATLLVDGKPQPSLAAALAALGLVRHTGATVALTNIGPGSVIRAGDSVLLVHVQSPAFAADAAAMERRVQLRVCYCSMLQQCWLKTSGDEYPTDVKSCPREAVDQINT